mmetsp:Transcript_115642/g.247133  ORF Transcript_115642/g.247133 Transcript_115642/m.247133 type:complete len:582 (+) Transcript_115642:99-1844(+)
MVQWDPQYLRSLGKKLQKWSQAPSWAGLPFPSTPDDASRGNETASAACDGGADARQRRRSVTEAFRNRGGVVKKAVASGGPGRSSPTSKRRAKGMRHGGGSAVIATPRRRTLEDGSQAERSTPPSAVPVALGESPPPSSPQQASPQPRMTVPALSLGRAAKAPTSGGPGVLGCNSFRGSKSARGRRPPQEQGGLALPLPSSPSDSGGGDAAQGSGGAANIVANFDEFLRRGTPRPAMGVGGGPGCLSGARTAIPTERLERCLGSWARARGLTAKAAPHLAFIRAPPLPESSPSEGPDLAERTPPPVAHEASIIWFGVEIVLELSCSVLAGTSAFGGSPGGSEVGSGGALIVTGARTECAWARAGLSVGAAARHASGGTIEAFLDTLAGAWHVNEATGGACEVECAAAAAGSTALDGTGTPAAWRGAIAASSTGLSIGSLSSGSPCDATAAVGRSASSSMAARSPCHSSRRSSAAPPPHRLSQCESLGDSADTSTEEEAEEAEGVNDFAGWLLERPPLWRFEHASQGLAWDFPPSKAEKHELLLLQLFAEERERQARQDAVQDSFASPDLSIRARRRCSSMH